MGACPFECCTYRQWTANAPIIVLTARRRNAPVAFRLKAGETVQGLTGVVVTTRAGAAKVFRATTVGARRAKASPGDQLLLLHYQGEGYWKFWFRGRIDSDQLPDTNEHAPDSVLDVRIVNHPRTVLVGQSPEWARARRLDAADGPLRPHGRL